jgi:hypothetical protein
MSQSLKMFHKKYFQQLLMNSLKLIFELRNLLKKIKFMKKKIAEFLIKQNLTKILQENLNSNLDKEIL